MKELFVALFDQQIGDDGWRWIFDNSIKIYCSWCTPETVDIKFQVGVGVDGDKCIYLMEADGYIGGSYSKHWLSFSEAELHINKIRKRLGYDPLHFPIQPPPVIYSGEEVLKTINQQKN